MKKTVALSMIMALAAGTASADVVWSEGFNSDYTHPGPFSVNWGVEFGPNIINAAWNTEGDAGAWNNNADANTSGTSGIVGGQDFVIGTVAAAGEIYTFTGDFGWQYGALASASDVAIHASQSGFYVDGSKAAVDAGPAADFVFGDLGSSEAANNLAQLTFNYTTTGDDIGKTITGRIRTVDYRTDGNLTQLLTDNWQVDVVPEPATLGLVGLAGVGLLLARRFRI